ncbi:TPA: ribosomal RNA small subunit methyltransferase A [Candidatus Falkowbacteria bacterium]|nr:ribosomal RNA small subunit methyltransferase A [Candidatus Falkowbacteria bacterium]
MLDPRKLITKYNVKPNHDAGQNFLVDRTALRQIVEAADLTDQDEVLEVGPGLGVLTEQLVAKAKLVVAVELDRQMMYVLKKEFRQTENLILINDSILKVAPSRIVDNFETKEYKIVANIPYNITAHFLRQFLETEFRPRKMVLLVQKEVAERVTARAGKMSLLGVSAQFFAEPKIVGLVPAKSFYPVPRVDSAILVFDVTGPRFEIDEKIFFQTVRIGFSAKRKQLKNNLAAGFRLSANEVEQFLLAAGLKSTVRAQELAVEDWARLAGVISQGMKEMI